MGVVFVEQVVLDPLVVLVEVVKEVEIVCFLDHMVRTSVKVLKMVRQTLAVAVAAVVTMLVTQTSLVLLAVLAW